MENLPESSETTEETQAIIALSLITGIGSTRCRVLVNHFGSACKVFEATHSELSCVEGIGKQVASSILSFSDFRRVDEQIEQAENVQARLITYWSPDYPALLRAIYDPPAFLWVRGALLVNALPALALVGTRKPSLYGKKVTYRFAHQLALRGITIVSGLAYGVDAVAHQATIDANGSTIAVLGSGVDRIYPGANKPLARQILERGAIISEFPLMAKPDAANFPRRNRIISGLSLGTLVAEAYEKGGALITARIAVEQNREVFAIPGSIFNNASEGTHKLIQLGYGKLVQNVEDILEELGEDRTKSPNKVASQQDEVFNSLNVVEKKLYDIISHEPMQINIICDKSGLDPSTALVYLLSLEFKGLVFQMAGKQFYKV